MQDFMYFVKIVSALEQTVHEKFYQKLLCTSTCGTKKFSSKENKNENKNVV